MRVWTIKDFEGHYPVGTSAVVVADTPSNAAVLLNAELTALGLPAGITAEQFTHLTVSRPHCVILNDGNY